MSITYPECESVALGINKQCACDILPSVACPAVHYFLRYPIKHTIKKKLLNIKCVYRLSVQILFETFLIYEELSEIRSKVFNALHVKYSLFLSDFNET